MVYSRCATGNFGPCPQSASVRGGSGFRRRYRPQRFASLCVGCCVQIPPLAPTLLHVLSFLRCQVCGPLLSGNPHCTEHLLVAPRPRQTGSCAALHCQQTCSRPLAAAACPPWSRPAALESPALPPPPRPPLGGGAPPPPPKHPAGPAPEGERLEVRQGREPQRPRVLLHGRRLILLGAQEAGKHLARGWGGDDGSGGGQGALDDASSGPGQAQAQPWSRGRSARAGTVWPRHEHEARRRVELRPGLWAGQAGRR